MTDRSKEPERLPLTVIYTFTVPLMAHLVSSPQTATLRLVERPYQIPLYLLQRQGVDALGDPTWSDESLTSAVLNRLEGEVMKRAPFVWRDRERRVVVRGELTIECRNTTKDGWVTDYSLDNAHRLTWLADVLNPRNADKVTLLPRAVAP